MRTHLFPLGLLVAMACRSAEPDVPQPLLPDPPSFEETAVAPPPDAAPAALLASAPVRRLAQDLQDTAEMLQRRREAQRSLAEEYTENGQAELARADLQAALQSFSAAVSLDPTYEPGRDGLRRVRSLLGDEYATAGEVFDDDTTRYMIKRAQALVEVEEHMGKGDLALREGRFDEAVQEYRLAEMVLRWNPLIATDSLDERLVRNKLAEAERLRAEAVVESARLEEQLATDEQLRREQEERERRENRLREFYEHANRAYIADRFGEAESWCHQILLEDPGNESAQYLLRVARESRHHRTDELNRKHYREQWLRTFEELDTMNIPQTEALQFHLDRWRAVSQRKPLSHAQMDPTRNVERESVLARLESVRFEPNFGGPNDDGTPLDSVASYLQQLTGVNFWISSAVRDELDPDETDVVLRLPERSVRKVLDIIAETRDSLRWKIEDGVVMFVTRDELTGGQILVTYGVQDLIHPIPDYPGRDINVSPSGGITPPDEDLEEREANVVNTTLLEDLIRNNLEPESWDADPANSIRINDNGIMVVNQVPEVQEKIAALLDDLREATGIMVDIQARFMKVEDNFLEDIGVDFRGLGAPGLGSGANAFNDFGDPSFQDDLNSNPGSDNTLGAFYDEGGDGDIRTRVEDLYDTQLGTDDFRGSGGLSFQWTFLNDLELELILRAVSKSERIELVTAPRILVHNTARANLSVLNQVAYVQDFDVEIAQAASIADPIVGVIQDGVILDVRPVVSADRRFITLELRPTIANLTRPIEERVTTLGSQNSVTIMLPEVEIQRVRTSIPIPDGGTIMLGGTKSSKKQDQRSGVPILNKIPILSAFFERKGKFVSNKKLLILLRAHIVIPEEVEPSPSELGLAE